MLSERFLFFQVNGQDTTNKRHMEAVNILRSTRNEVHLVIRRRPDKVETVCSLKLKSGVRIGIRVRVSRHSGSPIELSNINKVSLV
jgi:hypothetical protein